MLDMHSLRANRKLFSAFLSIALMIVAAFLVVPEEKSSSTSGETRVSRVVDGDTIELENGSKIRYIGVDTPESVDPRRGVECFGKEASEKNRALVEGKAVRLESDVSDTDKYDRLLRYVFVGDLFVNEYLVREGYARASSYPPDVKHQTLFLEAEREAREMKRGLWADGACGK